MTTPPWRMPSPTNPNPTSKNSSTTPANATGTQGVASTPTAPTQPPAPAKPIRKVVFDIETRNIFDDVGSFDPTMLDISVVAIYDSETDTYSSYTQEELSKLWPILEKADLLIGFNSDHFDLPLLNKYYPGDLTKIKSLDLLKEVKNSLGRRIKLDYIAAGTLGRTKISHGLEAVRWWKEGRIDDIKKYCIEDVRITKEVYDYAMANKKLLFKDGLGISEMKIDPSNWEKTDNTAMTFTLPF